MKKRFLCLALSLLMLLALLLPCSAAEDTAPRSNGHPYYIAVNRRMNTVTVYSADENGFYTVPERVMLCSTGVPGDETPLGSFTVTWFRSPWLRMIDGSYGQYSVQFYGNYLFHSVCYTDDDPSALIAEEYNDLGSSASHGCVRLQTADAKWIYDNIEPGTKVTVYESDDPGPLGKPAPYMGRIRPEANNGWDPTDPREENPWHAVKVESLTLEAQSLSLETGLTALLHAEVGPESAALFSPGWTSSDPAVLCVDSRGSLTALRPGKAVITASCGELSAECTVTVTGEALPFTDVLPGAWYYGALRHVWEKGMMRGVGEGRFDPDGTLTMAQALQFLYQMAGSPAVPGLSDAGDAPWYAAAVTWAKNRNLLSGEDFSPEAPAPREEFVRLLWLWEKQRRGFIPEKTYAQLDAFPDASDVSENAMEAMRWAVGADIVHGSDGLLLPQSTLTRAQAATLAQNFSAHRK